MNLFKATSRPIFRVVGAVILMILLSACGAGSENAPTPKTAPAAGDLKKTEDGNPTTSTNNMEKVASTKHHDFSALNSMIQSTVDPELFRYFELMLVAHVGQSSAQGQHLVVKTRDHEKWTVLYDLPIVAALNTSQAVPPGIYQFDPDRMTVVASWQSVFDLRYAMAFDASAGNHKLPYMIDGADIDSMKSDPAKLGSGIHLAFKDAHTLYKLLQKSYHGAVPQFAWDTGLNRTNTFGKLQRNTRGDLTMKLAYKALIVITPE